MKFKLDENLGRLGKIQFEVHGYDVMTVSEQNLCGAPDEHLFNVCRQERRVLVTLDHDFGQILRFPPETASGIVALEIPGRLSAESINKRITELIVLLKIRPIKNELWIIEPGRVRIHEI